MTNESIPTQYARITNICKKNTVNVWLGDWRGEYTDVSMFWLTNTETVASPYLTPGIHTQHIRPPPRLLPAGALHEGDPLRRGDGQAEGVAGDAVRLAHLQHCCHVDAGLGDCVWLWKKEK